MQSRSLTDERVKFCFENAIAIVGGGTTDDAFLQELSARGVPLIAADGGANAIAEAGLVPTAIIGDLDSITDVATWETKTQVIHIAEQITTDFQKALYSTSAPVTLAVGMTGRRLDHTLAALSAVSQIARERHVIMIDEVDVAMAMSGPFSFSAREGERVSIYPLLPIRFTRSSGLLYPLDGLTLEPTGLIGTSNAALGGMVDITPTDDTPWLLLLEKSRLWDLVAACL